MKKTLSIFSCLFYALLSQAQTNTIISPGTNVVMSAELHLGAGTFVNNGSYTDIAAGTLHADGGITFSGSGTTLLYDVSYLSGASVLNVPVAVHHTATIYPGAAVDANSELFIRSDVSTAANLVNNGSLTNEVHGIITTATANTGSTPYSSLLQVNVSGTEMQYQWQSSPDSTTWASISGATSAAYTAWVTGNIYYRCVATAANTGYSQATPGVQLNIATGEEVPDLPVGKPGVKVYPNPTSGICNVVVPAAQKNVYLQVTDVAGKLVDARYITDNSGMPVVFDLRSLTRGFYIVNINAGQYSKAENIEVQ